MLVIGIMDTRSWISADLAWPNRKRAVVISSRKGHSLRNRSLPWTRRYRIDFVGHRALETARATTSTPHPRHWAPVLAPLASL